MTCWVPTKMTKDPFKPTPPGIGDDEWMISVLGKNASSLLEFKGIQTLIF